MPSTPPKPKVAFITGITGQDGSYLAELLLSKGYIVHGLIRRSSTFNTSRIDHIFQDPHVPNPQLILHHGDLSDGTSIARLLDRIRPDEIYHLGAQSHVRVSFDTPLYTGDVTGLGTTRILEAIRDAGVKTKFYQASSSEMFGKVVETPQTEKTPFYPRSPYGVAKVYAYWMTVNYRESYGMFACNGILFNHETVASFMPMFHRIKGEKGFNIKPISEIVAFDESKKRYQAKPVNGIEVWGKEGWVAVNYASAYPHDIKSDNKKPRLINSRSGAFMATASHVGFLENGKEKRVGEMTVGDRLEIIDLPSPSHKPQILIDEDEAELIGMLVGDGSITYAKRGTGLHGKFTNSSSEVRQYFFHLWEKVTGGTVKYYPSKSGFNPLKTVGQLRLVGGSNWLRTLDLYNQDRTKRIPKIILNADRAIMLAFLRGYNTTDGLKSNHCTYEFKNFKTNSATLAMGVWYLIDKTTGQDVNLTVETKPDGRLFYSLNVLSTVDNVLKEQTVRELAVAQVTQRGIERMTGISRTFIRKIQLGGSAEAVHHMRKEPAEIKKIIDLPNYQGWFYDLETSSGEFHCGVGRTHVHNSPRRGETFVTRKITRGVANIVAGHQDKLYLGNLDAKRDWGYAPEYVEGMWRILQADLPDDYLLATGETHTVREFVDTAFNYVGLDWQKYVEIDPRYYRPAEVELLLGDATKAKEKLGWVPKTTFTELCQIMVAADMKAIGLKPPNAKADKKSAQSKRRSKREIGEIAGH